VFHIEYDCDSDQIRRRATKCQDTGDATNLTELGRLLLLRGAVFVRHHLYRSKKHFVTGVTCQVRDPQEGKLTDTVMLIFDTDVWGLKESEFLYITKVGNCNSDVAWANWVHEARRSNEE